MTVMIEQIRSRAEQSITRPFLCRGDDEHWYYVKGRGTGLRSLLCEWIAGRLGQAFGLSIAHFEQHVFAAPTPHVFEDLANRARYAARLEAALEVFDTTCDEVPEEWWLVDDGVSADFDRMATRHLLERFDNDDFWRRV